MQVPMLVMVIMVSGIVSGALGAIGFAVLHGLARARERCAARRADALSLALGQSGEANAATAEALRLAQRRFAEESRRASVAIGRHRALAEAVQVAVDKGFTQQARVDLLAVLHSQRTPRAVLVDGGAR